MLKEAQHPIKKRIKLYGFDISIENPRGSSRRDDSAMRLGDVDIYEPGGEKRLTKKHTSCAAWVDHLHSNHSPPTTAKKLVAELVMLTGLAVTKRVHLKPYLLLYPGEVDRISPHWVVPCGVEVPRLKGREEAILQGRWCPGSVPGLCLCYVFVPAISSLGGRAHPQPGSSEPLLHSGNRHSDFPGHLGRTQPSLVQ